MPCWPSIPLMPGTPGTPGTAGARGSVTLYQNGVAYSDSAATSLVLAVTGTAPTIGDTVNFTNGSGASATTVTRYWGGSAWLLPGVVINGNLLVGGNIASSSVNTSQYVKASGFVSDGSTQAAIWGENSTHDGFAVVGIASSATAAGAGYFNCPKGNAVYADGGIGAGVFGSGAIGVSGYSLTGVGVECNGKFRFVYDYARPDGSANKYMAADGTWHLPSLSHIQPNPADTPGFQFSTDGGASWTSILLRRV